jgi:hypothetical protein
VASTACHSQMASKSSIFPGKAVLQLPLFFPNNEANSLFQEEEKKIVQRIGEILENVPSFLEV